MDFKIDGDTSLKDQEITLNHTEKHAGLKLVSYKKDGTADKPHDNLATFEERDLATVLPLLVLSEAANGTEVWVSGAVKKVTFTRSTT